MSSPAVSVVMPVYNCAAYLPAALTSLREQTFGDFEIIAVDDGSTDHGPLILAEWTDPRLRLIRQERNSGLAAALNAGLALARAPLVARQDADDLSEPERFARQTEFLAAHPRVCLLGTAQLKIDPAGQALCRRDAPVADAQIRELMRRGNAFAHGSVMIRRSALDRVGAYREFRGLVEDYDLWLRLLEVGEGANLPEPLYRYRLNPLGIMAAVSPRLTGAFRDYAWRLALARQAGSPDPLTAGEPAWRAELDRLRQRFDQTPPPGPRRRRAKHCLQLAEDFLRLGDLDSAWHWTGQAWRAHPLLPETWRLGLGLWRRRRRGGAHAG